MAKSKRVSSKKHGKTMRKLSESEPSDLEESTVSSSETESSEEEEVIMKSHGRSKSRAKSRKSKRQRHRHESTSSEDDGSPRRSSSKRRSGRKKSKRIIEVESEETEKEAEPSKPEPSTSSAAATPAAGEHVSKFGTNAGQPAAVAPASVTNENAVNINNLLAETGINLDSSRIKDISVLSTDRMKEVVTFQLGSSYFIKVGPTPFHAQGGTYDAMCFGKIVVEKEGGKEKPVSINLPIRTIPQVLDALRALLKTFETGRNPLSVEDLVRMKDEAGGKDIDLVPRLQYAAPKEGFKIDTNHIICGESVVINKTSSYEAITVCRLPKTNGANGKPTKKFSISFPLRFLPTLVVLAEYVCNICNVNVE